MLVQTSVRVHHLGWRTVKIRSIEFACTHFVLRGLCSSTPVPLNEREGVTFASATLQVNVHQNKTNTTNISHESLPSSLSLFTIRLSLTVACQPACLAPILGE